MTAGRPSSDVGAQPLAPAAAPAGPFRISLAVWLILGFLSIAGVFLVGNFYIQQSTRLATQDVSLVQQRFEPLARRARELGDAVVAFDRAVYQYLESDSESTHAAID